MAFFKKYNGSTNIKLIRIERLVWVLIYGGLLSFVIGHLWWRPMRHWPKAWVSPG